VQAKVIRSMGNGSQTLIMFLLTILGRGIVINNVKIDNEWFARQIVTSLIRLILNEMRSDWRALLRRLC
jgi:hypothetical protein